MTGLRGRHRRGLAVVVAGFMAVAVVAQVGPHQHPSVGAADPVLPAAPGSAGRSLIAPPAPPTDHPAQPSGYRSPSALARSTTAPASTSGAAGAPSRAAAPASPSAPIAAPSQARTWGATGSATTLVLYDTTNSYGWLGELYAIAGGNLASHFGTVTAEPVVDYVAGQVNGFTATVYFGSTYNEPLPVGFLNDVLSTTKPVIWAGDNIWQLSGTGTAAQSFQAAYGWDPSTSWFDTTDVVTQIQYNGQTLTRDADAGAVLAPHITVPAQVTTLANAQCGTSFAPVSCDGIAQVAAGATAFPWAIQSANLTYVGEIPLSYITESDRYLAFSDLLFPALAPTAPLVHQALVRLEDVTPGIDTPEQLKATADYLFAAGVPFSVAVIPNYQDPNGANMHPVGFSENISQTSDATIVAFDDALRYMISKGGTIIEHGNSHQYSNVANPYSGASGDDFEFYRAQCATTEDPPYTFYTQCLNTDWVIQEGALPNDSSAWAQSKAQTGQQLFTTAGFVTPTIWETPHYSATAADYQGIDQIYPTRYEREQFFGGQLSGTIDASHDFGQFYPYVVHDVYGETVLPEDLGNYEPTASNNNPPKPPSFVVGNAQAELAVRQGVASFFFHPYYDVSYLRQIVEGIKGLGYTFVAPSGLLPPTPAPTVSSVSPTSGQAARSTQVTINGSNLGGATAVAFGTTQATIVSDTPNQIVATTPLSPAVTVDVLVTTAGRTSSATPSDKFSFVGATATKLRSSTNPVAVGKPVTYTAVVANAGTQGGAAPTGAVAFTDNGNSIAGCPPQLLGPRGTASCTASYPKSEKGSHSIVTTYTGDANHTGCSAKLVQNVETRVQ